MQTPRLRAAVPALAALTAPLASAAAVVSFPTHSADTARQLDLIASNVGGFSGMVLLENLAGVCVALACLAAAARTTGQGARWVFLGAFLSVLGLVGGAGGFGAALPTLARQHDRAAALAFTHDAGPIYGINGALAAALLPGLLLTLVGLWRAGALPGRQPLTLVAGALVLSFGAPNPWLMVLAFAVMAVPMSGMARVLISPAPAREHVLVA